MFEDVGRLEAKTPLLKNPRPSIFEEFDPLEATMFHNRGLTNPRSSIFDDVGPLEATTPLNRGFKKLKTFNVRGFRPAGGNDAA